MIKTMAKSRFNPSRDDLSENPPTPENLLRGFHGRPVKTSTRSILPIDSKDLASALCLGRSDVIFYFSDKRDPKDPRGEGAQGNMKRFYHDQKPESYFFVIPVSGSLDAFQKNLVELCQSDKLYSKLSKKGLVPKGKLPKKLIDLAELEKVQLSIGKQEFELVFEGYRLFVWDDMKTLMALPMVQGQIIDGSNIYMWCSKHTKVNWRGIID